MGFELVDRILSFEKNKSITGISEICLQTKEFLPFPGTKHIFPAALCLEALAQIGGLLIIKSFDFTHLPVLAMVTKAEIKKEVRKGDALLLYVQIEEIFPDIIIAKGDIKIDRENIAYIGRMVYKLIKIDDTNLCQEQQRIFDCLIRPKNTTKRENEECNCLDW